MCRGVNLLDPSFRQAFKPSSDELKPHMSLHLFHSSSPHHGPLKQTANPQLHWYYLHFVTIYSIIPSRSKIDNVDLSANITEKDMAALPNGVNYTLA